MFVELTTPMRDAARAFNARLEETLAAEVPVSRQSTAAARARDLDQMRAVVDSATETALAGPGGPLRVRRFEPPEPRGTCLYLHPGGWVLGGPEQSDLRLHRLARATRLTVLALGYRLAPEHPHPAGADDVVFAARHLADTAPGPRVVMGDSAGAHLAVLALVRLRDAGRQPFDAALLGHGTYDLAETLAMRPDTSPAFLDPDNAAWFLERYLPPGADPADPGISPVFADLRGLPPALLTVGARDVVGAHSRRLHERWPGSTLDVYPEGIHCFDRVFGHPLAPLATRRQCAFLERALASP